MITITVCQRWWQILLQKEESKTELLRFLDVPPNDPVRFIREYTRTHHIRTVAESRRSKYYTDTRAFRDTPVASTTKGKRYDQNPTGDVLGKPMEMAGAGTHTLRCGPSI